VILADHDQITRRLEKLEKDLKKKREPLLELEKTVLEKCKAHRERRSRCAIGIDAGRAEADRRIFVLSQRPMLYVLNFG